MRRYTRCTPVEDVIGSVVAMMEQQPASDVSLTFLKLMVLVAILYLFVVIRFSPPAPSDGSARVSEVAGVSQAAASSESSGNVVLSPSLEQYIDREASILSQAVPRARRMTNVHIGPSADYAILGLVPENGRLEVVGRSETGDWIAIVFTPGATFYGWVPASSVSGIKDPPSLKIVSLTPLISRQ